jgi:PAS domain S-box-containing protein
MKNPSKANLELIKDIAALKLRIQELEQSESKHREVEAALKESEERYRIAIEASNDGVAIVQNDVHVYVNQAFLKMFRYKTLDEILGKHKYCIVHPDDYERVLNYAEIRQKGNYAPIRYEFKGIRKNKTPIDIEVSVNTIMYKKKRAILAYLRDITERKRVEGELKESEERNRIVIDSSNDGIAIMKGDKHLYVNQRFVEMFGYDDPSEVIGESNRKTVHPDDFLLVNNINSMRQRGEPVPARYEFKGIKKNSTPVYLEVSATGTRYRGDCVSLVYLRDITENPLR